MDEARLATIRDWSLAIAAKGGHVISRLSVMPDHLHAALRCNHADSPNAIVDSFQSNLAFAVGQERIWQDSYYIGTFSEYNMAAVRSKLDAVSLDSCSTAPMVNTPE